MTMTTALITSVQPALPRHQASPHGRGTPPSPAAEATVQLVLARWHEEERAYKFAHRKGRWGIAFATAIYGFSRPFCFDDTASGRRQAKYHARRHACDVLKITGGEIDLARGRHTGFGMELYFDYHQDYTNQLLGKEKEALEIYGAIYRHYGQLISGNALSLSPFMSILAQNLAPIGARLTGKSSDATGKAFAKGLQNSLDGLTSTGVTSACPFYRAGQELGKYYASQYEDSYEPHLAHIALEAHKLFLELHVERRANHPKYAALKGETS